jgi:Rieske Fe-S protein
MAEESKIPRRGFLKLNTRLLFWLAGLLGLGGLIRFFSHESDTSPPSLYNLGPVNDLANDPKIIYQDIPAVLYRTGNDFTAYSLRCTHLGCTLENGEENYSCPCHGSKFSLDGKVLKGPALDDLAELGIEINEESHLLINTRGVR